MRSREDSPLSRRVLAGFMDHAGSSFRRINPFVDVCHVSVYDWYRRLNHDWYRRLRHRFEPDRDRREAVAVDVTRLKYCISRSRRVDQASTHSCVSRRSDVLPGSADGAS